MNANLSSQPKLSVWMFIIHVLNRWMPGPVLEEHPHRSGVLRRYASGYIEHVSEAGERTDVLMDLQRKSYSKRRWLCLKKHGGAAVVYHRVRKDDAVTRCARELGPVISVDIDHGFIFYQEGASAPSADSTPR